MCVCVYAFVFDHSKSAFSVCFGELVYCFNILYNSAALRQMKYCTIGFDREAIITEGNSSHKSFFPPSRYPPSPLPRARTVPLVLSAERRSPIRRGLQAPRAAASPFSTSSQPPQGHRHCFNSNKGKRRPSRWPPRAAAAAS